MTFQPWIRDRRARAWLSVGLLQWSHDLSAMDTTSRTALSSLSRPFNGAMTFQPWILRPWSTILSGGQTFNGAMTFQPWIRYDCRCHTGKSSSFNGAMTFQPWIPPSGSRSMIQVSSLQWSHDLSAMDTWSTASCRAGTVALQWSHDLSAMDTRPTIQRNPTQHSLQWSHDLSAMDTRKPRLHRHPQVPPSMEP